MQHHFPGPACPYKKGKSLNPETGGPACPYKKGKSLSPETGGPACPFKKGKLTKLTNNVNN